METQHTKTGSRLCSETENRYFILSDKVTCSTPTLLSGKEKRQIYRNCKSIGGYLEKGKLWF